MITDGFWNTIANDVIGLMGFDKHPECAKLKPTAEAMYTGSSFGILNYDTDFFEPIRNGTVKIHENDLSHLSPGKVHLDDDEETILDSDAFLCVTGWKNLPPLKFLPEGIDRQIGLAYLPSEEDAQRGPDEGLAAQADLLKKADEEIKARFPRLTVPMKFNPNYKPITETKAFRIKAEDSTAAPTLPLAPSMLYHFMVPGTATFLRTKDIAFAGYATSFSNVICAHIQGLWISAFFDGTLHRDPSAAVAASEGGKSDMSDPSLTLDEVHWQTILHNRFGKWRYPNDMGSKHPDFIFEAVQYLDMMMADLGLEVHRKRGWLSDITSPYGPEDYRSVNEEFETKFGRSDL